MIWRHDLALTVVAALALVALTGTPRAAAEESVKSSQLTLRTGLLSLSYTGPTKQSTGSYSLKTPLDLEFELFTSRKASTFVRGVYGYDPATTRMVYSNISLGRRYYFRSSGSQYDVADGADSVVLENRWRFYLGFEGGISRVVVLTYGPVLESASALVDIQGHLGINYQLYRNVGISSMAAFGYGYGFSSVSVNATIVKFLLGVSIYL